MLWRKTRKSAGFEVRSGMWFVFVDADGECQSVFVDEPSWLPDSGEVVRRHDGRVYRIERIEWELYRDGRLSDPELILNEIVDVANEDDVAEDEGEAA